ncbi:MAG: TrkH family potassium uptake protein [Bacillota bacterium]
MKKRLKMSPTQVVVLGFASVIFIGALLLTLPISSSMGIRTNFIDSLFTATSAVCVTGLVVYDTGTYWSTFGQVIILMLIQIGGLGIMTMSTMFALLLGRKITLRERLLIQESLNQFDLEGLVRLTKYILIATFFMESIGALIYMTVFIPEFGLENGIWMGIFHGVSSFCNAGFDLMGKYTGEFSSFTAFVGNPIVNLNAMMLIIVGGLGFSVWTDMIQAFRHKSLARLSLHTKVVLTMTMGLILFGALFIYAAEITNQKTIANMPFHAKILASLFHSVTPRTAGFNTLDMGALTMPSQFMTIILMFIGGSPGSTAGGVKTTTAGILLLTVLSVVKGREDTEIYEKRISKYLIYRALSVMMISFSLVVFATMVLSITENTSFLTVLFESTSAFGTVGLTMNYTPALTTLGRVIISVTMFAGRVGPLTLIIAFSQIASKYRSNLKYPEDRIIVG